MDEAAVSRARQHGVGLLVKYDYRFPSGPNGERLPSYRVATGCDIHGNLGAKSAAAADIEKFLTPADQRQIEEWLAELSVLTAGRRRDEMEGELMLTAYASRLAQYPADVVHHVLLKLSWQFWPTWAELQARCEAMTGPRLHMLAALRAPDPEPEREYVNPTDEERARIAALVNEMFPEISTEWRDAAVDIVAGKAAG